MPKDLEIQVLKRRYAIRDEGAYTRDYWEEMGEHRPALRRLLESASSNYRGTDRLHFRQGFLFRCGQLGG